MKKELEAEFQNQETNWTLMTLVATQSSRRKLEI
jgi:hypothetical protein